MIKPREFIIAPWARGDIATILDWIRAKFGPQTFDRYANLISTAIEQNAENPNRPGSLHRPEIAENCRTYHLAFSRDQAGPPVERIRHPRHFLLFRVLDVNTIEIGRVLHDSVYLQLHLPDDYRS